MSNGLERPAIALGIGESFDTVVVPHLDAGYRLARWLMRDEQDAEDVVQEASLRAFRYFRRFVRGDGRAWPRNCAQHLLQLAAPRPRSTDRLVR
jgi:DNA-directed RNA polymerase specialized sigma24 family protein